MPARAVADPVSTHAPGVAAEPASPSTSVEPASTATADYALPSALVSSNSLRAECVFPPPREPASVDGVIQSGRKVHVWTPERVTILARDYPAGVSIYDIVDAVNALPGGKVTVKTVGIKAAYFGLRRPARAPRRNAPAEPTEPTPSLTAEAERQPGAAREPRRLLDVSSQNLTPAGASPPPASFLPEPSDPAAPPPVQATEPAPRRRGGPSKDTPVWPRDKVDRLRALWATGLSTEEIGVKLGTNKNAVIGKAHRLRLPPRTSPILSPAVEFTDAELAIFLANPDKPAADIAHLFPNRTIQSLRAKRRTLQEQNILPPLLSSSDRSGVTESLPALASLAAPAGDDPSESDGADASATAPPEAGASALPWQMAVPSGRTRSAPTCGFIIGEGRTATQCDATAVSTDEKGNRFTSGAGMWCKEHRALVYTKVRPIPRLEAKV